MEKEKSMSTHRSTLSPTRKKRTRKTFRRSGLAILGFIASLSVIYAENSSGFRWDSFGVFSDREKRSYSVSESEKNQEEMKSPIPFFSAFAFKHPYEMKVFNDYYPEENRILDSIPGLNTRLPASPKISLQRREFFSLYPALGREEIFVMALAMSQSTKDSKNDEAYVGASTERRAYDGLTDVRSTVVSLPGVNQNFSRGMDNQAGNLLLGYLVGRAGVQMDLGWRMTGNTVGLAIPESAKSSIGFSYSLLSSASSVNKMDFFLQLSGIKRFNDKSLLAVEAPPAFRGWQQGYEYYVNPGFSISTRNLSFEGLVRLPLHQPFPNTDGLLTPEVQGMLGVKYRFSESSPNLPK